MTTDKYLVRVLVVLLHARFSVVNPIPFLLAAIFWEGHPYICVGSTTVLPDTLHTYEVSWNSEGFTFQVWLISYGMTRVCFCLYLSVCFCVHVYVCSFFSN